MIVVFYHSPAIDDHAGVDPGLRIYDGIWPHEDTGCKQRRWADACGGVYHHGHFSSRLFMKPLDA